MLLLFLMLFSTFFFFNPTDLWLNKTKCIYVYCTCICGGYFSPIGFSLPSPPSLRVCGKSKIAIESDWMIYFHCGNRVSQRHRVFLVDNSQNAQNLSRLADDWSLVYTFTYVHIRETTSRGNCESIISGCP